MVKDAPEVAPPLQSYLPTGRLLVVFRLESLPSINEILDATSSHPTKGGQLIAETRNLGYDTALAYAVDNKLPISYQTVKFGRINARLLRYKEPLTTVPVFTFCRYWREPSKADRIKANRIRDAFNVYLKAYVDGFTLAGLWTDDREELAPDVWIHYEGLRTPRLAEVYLWEIR